MRKLYLYILSFFLVISSNTYSQTATTPLTNSYAVVDNNNGSKMFFGQLTCAGCCGNNDNSTDERVVVTYEALNLTVTQTLLNQLKYSTSSYTDGSTSNPDLLEWNGGIAIGDVVNIYMVYLNNNEPRRTFYGEVTFEDDIYAVGYDWRHTLWFSGTRFSSYTSDNNNGDYPRYSKQSCDSKFKDRWFEPSNEGENATVLSSWTTQNTNYDWFQVTDINGNNQTPGYSSGTPMRKFRLGCDNGSKVIFLELLQNLDVLNLQALDL
jgi:hypothetical protein